MILKYYIPWIKNKKQQLPPEHHQIHALFIPYFQYLLPKFSSLFKLHYLKKMSTIRDFVPLTKLGEGTYSTVYKVRRLPDDQIYALKKVKMTQLTTKQKENALNEIRILASIESSNIISYKQAFFDEKIQVLCIVMQYADGGDLQEIINDHKNRASFIKQEEIWKATKNILTALNILHLKGIMHRDLKPANIFKGKQNYKLGDLNVSKVVAGNLAYTQTGTPYYASPEVWRDEPYDAKSDIWSLGCIVYQMAALKPPFQAKDMQELFKNVQNKPTPSIPKQYSKILYDLIQLCLNKKANFRPTANELLEHPQFSRYFNTSNPVIQMEQNKFGKEISNKKQLLLQTIKLPSDLNKLKLKLPESKYQSEIKKNKSAITQIKKTQEVTPAQFKSPIKLDSNINKSEVFKSPSARLQQPTTKLLKSPISEIKLNPKVSAIMAKYSQRIHLSDKKSNKVQRPASHHHDKNNFNVEKYIREQLFKRPPSMPRTQKTSAKQKSNQQNVDCESTPSHQIEQLRKKLIKKSRILSHNVQKPSWWN